MIPPEDEDEEEEPALEPDLTWQDNGLEDLARELQN